ncbi:MAG: TlpA family protein disulfide reductase [Planctomycetes bacterium]|nr:TlpA family protein disulfide reductase [Planctomycetota bacterium]
MRRIAYVFVVVMGACVAIALSSCERPQPKVRSNPKARPQQSANQPTSLVGQPAPAFVTVDPDGGTIDLNKHLGKDVIMLDFWATWCGPCIMAMPEVAGIAKEFKDRGLVFYAVNVGEDPDTVKEFLAKNKFDIPVAMDFDGKIQDAFMANGLPHTVLIGKDGRVQVDHLGYWKGFASELSAQVEELLAGKNLAGESSGE